MNDLSSELLEIEQILKRCQPAALTPDFLERTDLQLFGAELLDNIETELLEAELYELEPRTLDKTYLDQLDQIPIAADISELQPKALSNDFLDRLTSKLENVSLEEETLEDSNIVSFPVVEQKAKKNLKWIASAAVAACVGILCGIAFTDNDQVTDGLAKNKTEENQPQKAQNFIAPENLQRVGIIEVEDQGLKPGQPQFRVFKVVEMQHYSKIDENGHKIQAQRPVEKTILVPVQPD